jgi:hypothetical protein
MDVGQVDREESSFEEWFGGEGYEKQVAEYGCDGEVMAIGKGDGRCYRCGGSGHFSRDCATPEANKGKGKGNFKGKSTYPIKGGKGFGRTNNDGYNGYYSNGPKGGGKGKGYQGECWRCGKVGHKAIECAVKIQEVGDDNKEHSVHQVSVGSVWHIGCVACGKGDQQQQQQQRHHQLDMPLEMTVVSEVLSTPAEELEWTVIKKNRRPRKRQHKTLEICAAGQRTEITIDSAAEASVCPKTWGEEFGLIEVEEDKKLRLINASGGLIPHHGSRETVFKTQVTAEDKSAEDKLMGMGFEVCDVKKALAAVWKICEKGNLGQFGFLEGESFITNKKSGEKVFVKRKGGSYVLDVELCDPTSVF